MSLRPLALAGLFALAVATPARAALIVWSAPQGVTGDADVVTNGALVGALNLGDASVTSTTVNGVVFSGAAISPGTTSATFGNFQFAGQGGTVFLTSHNIVSANPPFSNLSPAYQALLSTDTAGDATPGPASFTLTISGLTVGRQYEFQWWSTETNAEGAILTTASAGTSVTLNANTGAPGGGVGQFATGVFTADSTSEVITFSGRPLSVATLNGLQLRDITPVSAVPAPPTLLLGLVGAGFAGAARLRRGATCFG